MKKEMRLIRVLLISILSGLFAFSARSQVFPSGHLTHRTLKDYPGKVTPDFDEKKLSIGACLGFDAMSFTHSLWQYYSPTLGFSFGFEVSYRNVYAFINGGMSLGGIRRSFDEESGWTKDKAYRYGMTDLSIGYAVLDWDPWKICPFVGYSISEISTSGLDDGERPSWSKFNPIAGFDIDYKVFGDIFIMPTTHHQDYLEFNVKARLFVSYSEYDVNAKGCSIHFMIGVSVVKKPLKIR